MHGAHITSRPSVISLRGKCEGYLLIRARHELEFELRMQNIREWAQIFEAHVLSCAQHIHEFAIRECAIL